MSGNLSVFDLRKGQINIDSMKSEIVDILSLVLRNIVDDIEACPDFKKGVTCNIPKTEASPCTWRLKIERSSNEISLSELIFWYEGEPEFVTFDFQKRTLSGLPLEGVLRMHSHLQYLFDGMLELFPSLLGRCEPYFLAAKHR